MFTTCNVQPTFEMPVVKSLPYDPTNCYSWVRYKQPNIGVIIPNTTAKEGAIAIMHYRKPDRDIQHYAYIEEVSTSSLRISECNMSHYYKSGCGERWLEKNDEHITGYYYKTP